MRLGPPDAAEFKIVWEMHYHAVSERSKRTPIAVWFYPKGQEPAREVLALFSTFSAPPGALDIMPDR